MTSTDRDQEQVRLLAIFHYVVAGITALFACFPIIYLVLGVLMMTGKLDDPRNNPGLAVMGVVFIVIGSVFFLLGWTLAVLVFLAGRNLARRRRLLFCQIVAGIVCFFFPFGTVLGVFSLIVLLRPSVKELFQQGCRV